MVNSSVQLPNESVLLYTSMIFTFMSLMCFHEQLNTESSHRVTRLFLYCTFICCFAMFLAQCSKRRLTVFEFFY